MTTTVSGTLTITVDEDAGPTSGSLTLGGTDPRLTPVIFQRGIFGDFTLDTNGNWTYTVRNAEVQWIVARTAAGETFRLKDPSGNVVANLDIYIRGLNDLPTFSGDLSADLYRDVSSTVRGNVSIVDPDRFQSGATAATNVRTTYGTFSIDTNGNWTYQLDQNNAAVRGLTGTQQLTDIARFTSTDGTSSSVTISIGAAPPPPPAAPPAAEPPAPPPMHLLGGSGIDYAVLSGSHASFRVDGSPGAWDPVSFSQGTDCTGTLCSIERIRFDDGLFAYDIDGNAGLVYRLYAVALDRAPDERGISHWVRALDGGMKAKDLAAIFLNSSEFKNIHPGKSGNAAFVEKLLSNILDRAPSADETETLVTRLNKGESHADILLYLAESALAKAATANDVKNGIKLDPLSDVLIPAAGEAPKGPVPEHLYGGRGVDYAVLGGKAADYVASRGSPGVVQVTGLGKDIILDDIERIRFSDEVRAFDDAAGLLYRLYDAILDRTPDNHGFSHLLNLLDQGMSTRNAAAAMLASEEGRAILQESLSVRDFIVTIYQHAFNRTASYGEVDAWAKWLTAHNNDRAALLIGIADSPEARAISEDVLKHGITIE